jgi:hypothetical protein
MQGWCIGPKGKRRRAQLKHKARHTLGVKSPSGSRVSLSIGVCGRAMATASTSVYMWIENWPTMVKAM